MTQAIAAAGLPTSAFLAEVPFWFRGLARRFAKVAGVANPVFHGNGSAEILGAARHALSAQRRGFMLMHWPDADRAGHAHGWMSAPYAEAARAMDASLGLLAAICEVGRDPGTLLIALADHGGGGVKFNDHDSAHAHDRTIPVMMFGAGIAARALDPSVSLLDVPPTVLHALGVRTPASWTGRPLLEALPLERVAA